MPTTDALTGLGNRRMLLADLQGQAQTVSSDHPLLLVLLDLNGFKHYNDTFGHPAGDALLARLANALTRAVQPFGGRAYRPGGDEFCVIAPDASQRSRVESAVSQALCETGKGFAISAAFGSAVIPTDAQQRDSKPCAGRRRHVRTEELRAHHRWTSEHGRPAECSRPNTTPTSATI